MVYRTAERVAATSTLSSINSYQGNAILEIRAGAGGSEAQLFAKEIFDMYYEYPIIPASGHFISIPSPSHLY